MAEKQASKEMTLKEALDQGLVVEKSLVDEMIAQELEKVKEKFKKEALEQVKQERQNAQIVAIEKQANDAMIGTGLTNVDFVKRLLRMHIPREHLKLLRDEHCKLGDKEIWKIVRENAQ